MKKTILSILVTLSAASTTVMAQPKIPADLATLVNQALALSFDRKAVLQFDAVMEELARKTDSKTFSALQPYEGQSLQAKVIVVAYVRAQKAEMCHKLMDVFYNVTADTPGLKDAGGPSAPQVDSKYQGEEYRLIWEYLLLSLDRKGENGFNSQGLAGWRPIEALGKICNEKSLVLLGLAYQRTIDDKSIRLPGGTLGTIAVAIYDIGSSKSNDTAQAFKTYLACLAITEQHAEEFSKDSWNHETPDECFLRLIKVSYPEILAKWQAAASAYPKDKLTPGQATFIQNLISLK